MKKTVSIALTILFVGFLSAQEQTAIFLPNRNEVKLNLPVSIFCAFPEISYERILQEDISVGASLGVSVDGGDSYGYKFQFTPYFRWFFGGARESARRYAAGLFMEVNASVLARGEEVVEGTEESHVKSEKENETGAGLGIGVGWKYVSKNNWVGEILLGVGKDFSNSGNAYPHVGISIGKRF